MMFLEKFLGMIFNQSPSKSTALADEKKLEILHQHYRDTFQSIQTHIAARQRYFYLLIAVSAVMLFQIYSPYDAEQAITGTVSKQLGASIDVGFLTSVIWFCACAFFIRYAQIVVWLERQYSYLHSLEEGLNSHFGGVVFTREGKAYLSQYPLFSEWASILYNVFFPILFIAVIVSKILREFSFRNLEPLFYINVLIFLGLMVSVLIYVVTMNISRFRRRA